MPAPGRTDPITLVDTEDQPVATAPRAEAFSHPAGFRTVHAFLFDPEGKLLLQRLAPERERNPGKWGSSVAAYLHAGEGYGEAISRRIREEIGIDTKLVEIGKTEMLDRGTRKFVTLFTGRIDALPEIREPDHISELRSFSTDEIDARIDRNSALFTETFRHLWSSFGGRFRERQAAV